MTPDAMNSLLSADPFVPFRLTLTTGETVDIRDPNPVYIANLSIHFFELKRIGEHMADRFRLISLRHVVKIEQLEAQAA